MGDSLPDLSNTLNNPQVETKEITNCISKAVILFLKFVEYDKLLIRFFIIFLVSLGFKQKKISDIVNLTTRQIRNIKNQFDGKSSDSLLLKNKPGRPKKKTKPLVGKVVYIISELKAKGIKITNKVIANNLADTYDIDVSEELVRQIINEHELIPFIEKEDEKPSIEEEKTFLGHSRFGGGFLLIPFLVPILSKLKLGQRAIETILTIIASCLAGIKRNFHLKDVTDKGIALFTGRTKVMDNTTFIHRIKEFSKAMVEAVYQFSLPTELRSLAFMFVVIDEHVIPRWSKIFKLGKTKHSTRNRVMKADKLLFAYEVIREKLLTLKVMKGTKSLTAVILPYVRELKKIYGPKFLKIMVGRSI
jgi:transposase